MQSNVNLNEAPRAYLVTRRFTGGTLEGLTHTFDNPAYGDRYTIIYGKALAFHTKVDGSLGALPDQYHNTYLQHLSASENPTHPQGIGMPGEFSAHDAAMYRLRNKHRKVKWSSLPERLRAFVLTNGPEV